MSRTLLIVGATGQQGRATLSALHDSPQGQDFRILALTRSVASRKSQDLKKKYPKITLVEGDLRNPSPIFATHKAISAIFLVTVPPDEEAQALPLIDAACTLNSRVEHIVFSSVDRGGDEQSWNEPTPVPHFASKHRIELYLRNACTSAAAKGRYWSWTILRPTGFMDNYNPGQFGSLMAALWKVGMSEDRKMQLVSTHDIGIFAAKVLLNPERWSEQAIGLAGCEMSYAEMNDVFKTVTGNNLPQSWSVLARGVLWWADEAKTSFEWFEESGYKANIETLKHEMPELQDFEKWLRQSSRWNIG